MTSLSFFSLAIPVWTLWPTAPKLDGKARLDDAQRRQIVGDLIAAGACDSEYGAQMMMSVFPDQF